MAAVAAGVSGGLRGRTSVVTSRVDAAAGDSPSAERGAGGRTAADGHAATLLPALLSRVRRVADDRRAGAAAVGAKAGYSGGRGTVDGAAAAGDAAGAAADAEESQRGTRRREDHAGTRGEEGGEEESTESCADAGGGAGRVAADGGELRVESPRASERLVRECGEGAIAFPI